MTLAEVVAPFDAGRREFSALVPRLWGPLGRALVERVAPSAGERVLDVCCGDGASAIPAAHAVGSTGAVDAIDGAAGLLEHGRAAAVGLPQLRFTRADATTWTSSDGPYDVVQSGYGVFFLPDMDASVRRLTGLLRPGGRLAVSAWKRPALRAFAGCLVDAVEKERGEPIEKPQGLQPAERIDGVGKLGDWMRELGLTEVEVWSVPFDVPLDAELAWQLVVGTGFRGMLGKFDERGVQRVRAGMLRRIEERGLHSLDAGSVVGVGHRTARYTM